VELLAAHTVGAAFVPLDPSTPAAYRQALRERLATADARALAGLAWVVFTSGSTGRPKGVCVGFGGVEGLLRAQVSTFDIRPESRVLWALSPGFDASFSDVGTALYAGATLFPYPGATSNFQALLAFLHTHAITHADLPPSLLTHIDPEALPRSLQTIIVGGEPCPPHALRAHARHRRVVNVYGPTEATVCTSMEVISNDRAAKNGASIGVPLEGVQYTYSDGELVIAGPAVARGYLDDAALTAARFTPAGYRTGDRVREEADGSWTFEGRLDRQVKIAGKLVAPEELEACLRAVPGVRSAIVAVIDGRLVATVDASCNVQELHASYTHLPRHLHPSRILRGAATVSERGKTQGIQAELQQLTSSILGRAVGGDEALGLDSLRRIELVAGIEGELGVCLPTDALSDVATLRDLDRVVGAANLPGSASQETASLSELVARFPPPPTPADRVLTNMHSAPVFLTGATGLLGAHVARALGQAGVPLRVLVRARTEQEGRDRLERLGIVATPVLGDLTDHALLAAEAGAASTVIHLAASLRLDANIDALYPENVAPLAPLLASGTTLVFASSLAVLAFSSLVDGGMNLDPTQSVDDARIFGGYAQSKALAEAWCAVHPQAHVLRIGLVVPDDAKSPSGRCPLRALTAALHLLGMRPSGNFLGAAFDAVPLTAVVEALLACVRTTEDAFSDPASRRAETDASSDPASRRAETDASSDPASRRAETDASSDPASRRAEKNASSDPASRRAEKNASSDPASRRAETDASSDPASRRAEKNASPKAVYAATPATVEDLYAAFKAAGRPLAVVPAEDFRNAVYRSPLLPLERRTALELLRVSEREPARSSDNNVLFRLTGGRFDPSLGVPTNPRQTLLRLVAALP
jgi:hypothetical protein